MLRLRWGMLLGLGLGLAGCGQQGVWLGNRYYKFSPLVDASALSPQDAPPGSLIYESHPPAAAPQPVPAPPKHVVVAAKVQPPLRRPTPTYADRELDQVYQRLSDRMNLDQQLQLSSDQTTWLNERNSMCTYDGAYNTDCGTQMTEDRIAELAAQIDQLSNQPPAGPGNTTPAPTPSPPTEVATQAAPAPASPPPPRALSQTVTVPATAKPWVWQPGGLNADYAFGVDDGTGPSIIRLASLDAAPGQKLTIRYTAGQITLGPGSHPVGAAGYAGQYDHGGVGMLNKPFPSTYMHNYPINLGALVGTFTNAQGKIVGTPFPIGNGPVTRPIPPGAQTLQLGINDDIYGTANPATANAGSLTVTVSSG